MTRPSRAIGLAFPYLITALCAACSEDPNSIGTIEQTPDAGCVREVVPRTYEVYFVIDVSGSMGPFLDDLSRSMTAFAQAFPERDSEDQRVLVNYYVVGFVNDVKWFPDNARRMTSDIAVQDAINTAISAGSNGRNLVNPGLNSDTEENVLDALAEVIASSPPADAATMVMLATDAEFKQSPATLEPSLPIHSTYTSIRADLESMGARVHAFTPMPIDGLTRDYLGAPPLTTLPGSTIHDIHLLATGGGVLSDELAAIARGAACL